jgi:hypothetical protein
MVAKLIGQQLQHLYDLRRSWDQKVSELTGGQCADTPRHFAATVRDLQRATQWYEYLRNNNL